MSKTNGRLFREGEKAKLKTRHPFITRDMRKQLGRKCLEIGPIANMKEENVEMFKLGYRQMVEVKWKGEAICSVPNVVLSYVGAKILRLKPR